MKLTWVQHVPYEGLAAIEDWARQSGLSLEAVLLHRGDPLPEIDALEFLVVMGGPMGVHDGGLYPWLGPEIELLRQVAAADLPLLGICLGAQLLARALGSEVHSGCAHEVGWFPVKRNPSAEELPCGRVFPSEFTPFHWHADMFQIPRGAVALGESARCPNQGFFMGNVVGLQFHLELRVGDIDRLVGDGHLPAEAADEAEAHEQALRPILYRLLDAMAGKT